jgi:hypothetical protein
MHINNLRVIPAIVKISQTTGKSTDMYFYLCFKITFVNIDNIDPRRYTKHSNVKLFCAPHWSVYCMSIIWYIIFLSLAENRVSKCPGFECAW